MRDDEDLETYLRQFEPVAPAPLPASRRTNWPWLTAAAAVALMAVTSLFTPGRGPRTAPPGAVTRPGTRALLALDDAALERALAASSSSVLPDPARRDRVLHAVAAFPKDL